MPILGINRLINFFEKATRSLKKRYSYKLIGMKKVLFILLTVTIIGFACTPKASPAVTEATIPSATVVSNDAGTIEAGRMIFTTKCTQCHKEKPIAKWTYEKLRPTLASMVRKAKLTNTEIGQVSAYVHASAKK
jgi:uncharacterized membrane protein